MKCNINTDRWRLSKQSRDLRSEETAKKLETGTKGALCVSWFAFRELTADPSLNPRAVAGHLGREGERKRQTLGRPWCCMLGIRKHPTATRKGLLGNQDSMQHKITTECQNSNRMSSP